MQLSSRQLYDYRDQTRAELLLTRAGHHLWLRKNKLRAKSGDTYAESEAIGCALETIWEAKRQVRAELKLKGQEAFKRWRARANGRTAISDAPARSAE
jgi:hypothetical protein